MDMGFGPSVPEPFGYDPLDMVETEIDQFHPDPLGRTLENLENSIEESLPPSGMPDALLDTTLDMVECSTEGQVIPGTQLPEHMQDHHLWNLMDALEKETENQTIKPQEQIEAPAPEPDEVHGSFQQGYIPLFIEPSFIRNYPYPVHRMTGSNTGIRCNSSGIMHCRLYDIAVSPDECDRCDAFEPVDDASGDDERCIYAF
jgi:hypothetical protein